MREQKQALITRTGGFAGSHPTVAPVKAGAEISNGRGARLV